MRWFLKTMEAIRNDGIFFIDPNSKQRMRTKTLNKDYSKGIELIQPIVFYPKNKEPKDITSEVGEVDVFGPIKTYDLDAPFKYFSIEMFGDSPITFDKTELGIDIFCIFVFENEPKQFTFLSLVRVRDKNFRPTDSEYFVAATNSEGAIVSEMIKRLNIEKIGTENTRQVIKLGFGENKKQIRIRKIVHVCPKSKQESLGERNVDWSHRFFVRGHWRDLEGKIGKDRDGIYCVNGKTWVSESIKGPEDKPVISKVRVVE